MPFESLTDQRIDALIRMPKHPMKRGEPKAKKKAAHLEWCFHLISEDKTESFDLLLRQNTKLERDFSAILMWHSDEGDLILVRCNGSSHRHGEARFKCHVHKATEHALQQGYKPESHADITTDYSDLQGAKHYLVTLASIQGVNAPPVQPILLP